tara:strand:- start:18 stop:854 length:837 start_codon:yes stop_codon:yes gene_type:complete
MSCDNSYLRHNHHIIPRYMGGTDDAENLVEVSVTQHAMFHFCNFQLLNNVEDYVAWRGLSGQISEADFLKEKFIIFGKIGSYRLQEKLKNNLDLKLEIEEKRLKSWNKNKEKYVEKLLKVQPKAVELARTPEARKKQKKKLKEIKHQQGESNSQYGTIWIFNLELGENKKISKNEQVPEGWNIGRIINFKGYFRRQKRKEEKKLKTKEKRNNIRQEKIKLYTEWYEIYENTNFRDFCEITGYSKSQQNLCSKFNEYVVNYFPKAKNGREPLDKHSNIR